MFAIAGIIAFIFLIAKFIEMRFIEKENKPIEAKIVLLGDQNVGKSSIAQRFCKNLFHFIRSPFLHLECP